MADKRYYSGIHRVHWDGTNDLGRSVSTGVYFCRFRSGDVEHGRKLVLLR